MSLETYSVKHTHPSHLLVFYLKIIFCRESDFSFAHTFILWFCFSTNMFCSRCKTHTHKMFWFRFQHAPIFSNISYEYLSFCRLYFVYFCKYQFYFWTYTNIPRSARKVGSDDSRCDLLFFFFYNIYGFGFVIKETGIGFFGFLVEWKVVILENIFSTSNVFVSNFCQQFLSKKYDIHMISNSKPGLFSLFLVSSCSNISVVSVFKSSIFVFFKWTSTNY